MTRAWWRDPGYRRDVFIVLALVSLGLLFNVVVGVAVTILLDLLGLWTVEPAEAYWERSSE